MKKQYSESHIRFYLLHGNVISTSGEASAIDIDNEGVANSNYDVL